ncbi:hypothetical protein [Alicycliphilus denitrificans]|uniref:hypothetical protein n=1 Tax=Alicycliphilus denitrificans TaxID=179636 RepID=UPI0001DA020E|nr:hypothetical protein [Alicycliphilus denitrificans]ADU99422.1 putative neutral zinc metalloprotease [Alicycliphilus denitrificans BC]
MHSEQDARIAGLIDERRKVAARLADLDMQIAQAVGDREGMRRAQREMYAQVEARKAARFAAWEASH